jgi:cytochrome b subunit of formate dehydrogenase
MVQCAAEVADHVSLTPRMVALLSALLLFTLSVPALGQSANDCLTCHAQRSLIMTKHGRAVSLFVDGGAFKNSVHAPFSCVDCHTGFKPFEFPHAKNIGPVQCGPCHDIRGYDASVHGKTACKSCHGTHDMLSPENPESITNRLHVSSACGACHVQEQQGFLTSAHGIALVPGRGRAPSCVDCHGAHDILPIESAQSHISRANEPGICLKCHLDDPEVRKQVGVSSAFIAGYSTSVHGIALAAGNLKSATCSDCHGAHDLKSSNDRASRVNKWNIAETCSRCHPEIAKIYDESIHGKALKRGIADAPTCTDCHGEHQIYAPEDPRSRVARKNVSEQVCANCHNSVKLNQKYGIPTGRFNSFYDSYHGLASRAGSVEVANCASCHGVHNIKPSSDPTSTINENNLAATCGHCHPGANRNFARGAVHIIRGRVSGGGILNWIRGIYIVLIVVVIGAMFLHNFFDFLKKTRHHLAVRRGKVAPRHYGSAQFVRMTLNERIQHAVMFVSFILLALTGFMLRYPDSWWVIPIRQMSDRFFEVRSIMHRIAGVVMITISLFHLFYINFTKRGKQFVADVLPKWKDVGDIWKNLRYITGFSRSKPHFDRFGYIEKVEYWALVWGVIIMATTGIILWFDNYFIGLLTKLGWDVARTVHFYEACLATLAILVWHFYFVLFNPDVYPMSTVWLTGKISEEEMAEEHPLELSRIKR